MKKVFKKSIACLIAVLMVFSTMPFTAFASDNPMYIKKGVIVSGYSNNYGVLFYTASANDYAVSVLKGVDKNGVITVEKGLGFSITQTFGKYSTNKGTALGATAGGDTVVCNQGPSWHYGDSSTAYALGSTTSNGSDSITHWYAQYNGTNIQSGISGTLANKATQDNNRATASDGGSNEATGIYEFTTTSFPQLNTPGEYQITLNPTVSFEQWKLNWGYKWNSIYGATQSIPITVRVVENYTFVNAAGTTVKTVTTTNGASDAYNQRPANTASKIVNNKNGTHTPTTYSWPATPNSENKFVEQLSGTPVNCTYKYTIKDNAQHSSVCTVCGYAPFDDFHLLDENCTCVCGFTKHNWGAWESISDTEHKRVCANNDSHIEKANHTFENGVCTVCSKTQTFTIKFKNLDGSEISSKVYKYGETVEIPELPDTLYTYNSSEKTHTATTYSWNSTPNTIAQGNATYQVIPSNSSPVACTFGDTATRTETVEKDTYDIFTCSVCGGEMRKRVADKTALNAAIDALENDFALPEAGYKYDPARVQAAKDLITEAKALGKYADQLVVDAMASNLETKQTELNAKENLAKYNFTFKIMKYNGDEEATLIKEFTDGYASLPYGDVVTFDKYVIPTIEDENSSLNGLPMYAVYKWVKVVNGKDQKLNTTDIKISDVVKSEATYICYLLDFKATDDTQTTTRVRYLDKSGKTIDFDTATVGTKYTTNTSISAPKLPYYVFDGWKCVFGTPDEVGTREIVYQATYKYDDTALSNKCKIQGIGVLVNGKESCDATYDSKVVLTGATKYAFCDSTGKIISYINADYIYTPHINGTVYITKVETASTQASTAVTGHFTQLNTGTTTSGTKINTLYVNAQYYLPEGATAIEAGIVISSQQKTTETLVIGGAGVIKVISDTQGTNHEYSIGMTYTKTGTLYTRSYLICKLSDGTTKTVYSDDVTVVNL